MTKSTRYDLFFYLSQILQLDSFFFLTYINVKKKNGDVT